MLRVRIAPRGATRTSSSAAASHPSSSFVPLAAARRRRRAKLGGSRRRRVTSPRERGSPAGMAQRPGRCAAVSGEGRRGGGPGFPRRGRRSWWLHEQRYGRGLGATASMFGGSASRAPERRLRSVGALGRRGGMVDRLGLRLIRSDLVRWAAAMASSGWGSQIPAGRWLFLDIDLASSSAPVRVSASVALWPAMFKARRKQGIGPGPSSSS